MALAQLRLISFRNYSNQTVTFSNKLNLIIGRNAQGKTNLLEAINLLATTKSNRTGNDAELIKWSREKGSILGKLDHTEIEMIIEQNGKKYYINRKLRQATDLIGKFLVVFFSPEDIRIISGEPILRRKFLDRLLAITDKKYLAELSKLQRILKIRNKILYMQKLGKEVSDLSIWNKQLVETGSFVWSKRLSALAILNKILTVISKKILVNQTLLLTLRNNLDLKTEELADIKAKYQGNIDRLGSLEQERALTLVGPHRDDIQVEVEELIGERFIKKDLKIFGSRGEQRAAILALKLAELEFIENEKKSRPSLLLDDVLSEFDDDHQKLLIATVYKQQTFITSTSIDIFPLPLVKNSKVFYVSEGEVEAEKA